MITQQRLEELVNECAFATKQGRVASYIPKLAEADPQQLGVYWMDLAGHGRRRMGKTGDGAEHRESGHFPSGPGRLSFG